MSYVSGMASNIYDVIEEVDTLLQNVGWTREERRTSTWNGQTRTSYCLWRGRGDGNDRIYLQARIPSGQAQKMFLDSMTGLDPYLEYFEQPGSIQQWNKSYGYNDLGTPVETTQPMFTVTADEKFAYWFFADSYRVIGICRMSIVYESFYAGFLNPIASERQYPYPMYVCGNGVSTQSAWPNNVNGSFVFPQNGQGMLRRADGTWRTFDASRPNPNPDSQGTIFPYDAHNLYLVPNYHSEDVVDQDNFLLIPIMLHTINPTDVNGLLRDVYWISGTRDVAAEQILTYNNEQYIVFDTKQDRGANTYFAIKMV